jgi:O-antigen/teichoic acid export membrane protein
LNKIKKLAGQTAIYGLGTIVPRLLNYLLLTPFYTYIFAQGNYGIFTELYAYVAFLLVILTYGMETTFFRFAEKEKNPNQVFSTALFSIFFTTTIFIVFVYFFLQPIANAIHYENNPEYIVWIAIIVGIDAISSIPFAKLRQQNKAIKFVVIKLINVVVNIGLNLFFLVYCPKIISENPESILNSIYSPNIGVGYAFISNLIASAISFLFLIPTIVSCKVEISFSLLKRMLKYSYPLLIVGIAGIMNEHADKILLKHFISVPDNIIDKKEFIMSQIGIYGANYKLAVLMTIFIQMFRYAAEPFFFSQEKEKNSDKVYADILKYFTIFGLLIFLSVTLYIDVVKYFIGPEYRVGLKIVPIVLLANLFLGIFYNLSVWYKLKNLTHYGAIIAISGSLITIITNIIFIPKFGYTASAWATLACYVSMVIMSYSWGRKYLKIPYAIKNVLSYIAFAILIFIISNEFRPENRYLLFSLNTIYFAFFILLIYFFEKKILQTKKNN